MADRVGPVVEDEGERTGRGRGLHHLLRLDSDPGALHRRARAELHRRPRAGHSGADRRRTGDDRGLGRSRQRRRALSDREAAEPGHGAGLGRHPDHRGGGDRGGGGLPVYGGHAAPGWGGAGGAGYRAGAGGAVRSAVLVEPEHDARLQRALSGAAAVLVPVGATGAANGGVDRGAAVAGGHCGGAVWCGGAGVAAADPVGDPDRAVGVLAGGVPDGAGVPAGGRGSAACLAVSEGPNGPELCLLAADRTDQHCTTMPERVARRLLPHPAAIKRPHQAFVIKPPVMDSPAWLSTFIGAEFALPAKAIAIASALSSEGKPRLRMSSFDSILIRRRESMPHLIEPSWAASLSSSVSMSISPCSNRSRNVQ